MAKHQSTARLGVVSDNGLTVARETIERAPSAPVATEDRVVTADFFIRKDGVEFAGTHLLVELWQASGLDDLEAAEAALRRAATAAGATILNVFLHHFGEGSGFSGVVVLAESHISIHTWPERGYAAVDIFMCGRCDPYRSVPVLKAAFKPGAVQVSEAKRGLIV
jgi:S-adenosylmethionine decarboxylase